MYFPFTGESNVNVSGPDFLITFTCAHEMAHQAGVAPEGEASFCAFIACINADDPYPVYASCAYILMQMLSDLSDEARARVIAALPDEVRKEYASCAAFYRKYAKARIGKIATAVNNSYLRSQGVEKGVDSYDDVTRLVVRYLIVDPI